MISPSEIALPPAEPAMQPARRASPQAAAETLDTAAGLLQVLGLDRIGNPEGRAEPERRALHHRHAFLLQQLGHEVLVGCDRLAGGGGLADGALAARVDIERALGLEA